MTTQIYKNVMSMLVDGARCRSTIATTSLLPNMVMASVIIQASEMTGLFEVIGQVCEPMMVLQGLPGEPVTVLLAAVMNMGGGVGVCANLAVAGALSEHDAVVLLPVIYLMGNPVQNVDRCLGTAGVHSCCYPLVIAVCVINVLFSTQVTQVII